MSNGKVSPPFANGYNTRSDMVEGIQLTSMRSDHEHSRTPTPHGVMLEYTDSDIISTTSSQKSIKQLNNAEPQMSSPTVSLCSKETEI